MTTTQASTDERTLLVVSARAAAIAWLNAFLASSQDPERAILYRSLGLEFFSTGFHLVGCDGTALFRSWVPVDEAAWPANDEAPDHSIVVMDPDGFGIGFMRALLRVTTDEAHATEELTITTAASDDAATPSLGAEFLTERVILRACGQRIDLRLFETAYPDWRRLNLGIAARERLDTLTLAPRILGLIGKLKGVHAVDLDFHGKEKQVGFLARGEGSQVRGLLMPMRRPETPST